MSLGQIKAYATGLVFIIAVLQMLEMIQVKGYVKFLPVSRKTLTSAHRAGGVIALLLSIAIALGCVFGENPGSYALIHILAGAALVIVLAFKAAISLRLRRLYNLTLPLGIVAGALALFIFVTKAVPYL